MYGITVVMRITSGPAFIGISIALLGGPGYETVTTGKMPYFPSAAVPRF
jgi:hypothetical protein